MRLYFFLCDHATESECLSRHLLGTTSSNIEWALMIVPGDEVFLYNFQTGDVWGPFEAVSTADCHERQAWGGKFPVQIRVEKTSASRKGNLKTGNGREFLTWRGSRPPHVLDDPLASSLMSWMVEHGTDL
jgi:development and cell death domain-containing protein